MRSFSMVVSLNSNRNSCSNMLVDREWISASPDLLFVAVSKQAGDILILIDTLLVSVQAYQ